MNNKKFKTAYEAGYDAGLNGANTTNSHFSWFTTKEMMKEWERGNKAGTAVKNLNTVKR